MTTRGSSSSFFDQAFWKNLVIMAGAVAAVITAIIAVQNYFADKTKEAITTAVAPIATRLDGIDGRLNKIDQRLNGLEKQGNTTQGTQDAMPQR